MKYEQAAQHHGPVRVRCDAPVVNPPAFAVQADQGVGVGRVDRKQQDEILAETAASWQ